MVPEALLKRDALRPELSLSPNVPVQQQIKQASTLGDQNDEQL